MTEFSTPWVDRTRPAHGGLAGLVVGMAKTVYAMTAPVLRRFPAQVFFGALAGGVAGVWIISLLAEAYLSDWPFFKDLLIVVGIATFVAHIPLFAIWWERKVSAHIQSRCGPMRVGGWHGWAQSFADGIKLICKEDLVPAHADSALFRLAPYVVLTPVVVAFMTLPFGAHWVFRQMDIGLLFILAMLGVEVVGVIMAGWASNSKWTVYGAMREACQMVSYEIPLGVALLLPVMTVGSLNLTEIGQLQTGGWHTWLAFESPFMFCAALAYYIAALASCKRAPFDLPESESELVAGFLTEYSGLRWSLFFFAEYAAMYLVSALAVILFFGGWSSPLPESWGAGWGDGPVMRAIRGLVFGGPIWLVVKAFILVYVQMWLRWTLPRVRIDQVLYACVQVMLPLMLALLLGQTLWLLWVPAESGLAAVTRGVLAAVGGLFVLGSMWVIGKGVVQRRRLVGNLAVDLLPGS